MQLPDRFIAIGAVVVAAYLVVPSAIAAPDGLPPVIDAASGDSVVSGTPETGVVQRAGGENQTVVDMFRRLQVLQEEVQALRGQFEEQTHELEGVRQRQRDLYVDIDRRLRDVEKGGVAGGPSVAGTGAVAGVPAVPASTDPAATAPAAGAVVNAAQEQAVYEQAFELLKTRRYDDAITAFRKYLADYSSGSYRDNAQYWIGEATYVMRRFPTAIEEFKKVEQLYPTSAKVSDAMVKIGFSYYELQEWAQARQMLERLVQRFPDSTAARLGQQRLQKMKQEGR
ncbi:MAG: hypothetical protein FD165_1707 [Gammaproteobacteria bacterium]|nr:MAG: hypothetical protein FD165_1707 [Gammaproteobacteria bacterium]TND04279.1 MAG: hypothetical protein FD120_1393 [Gammaproteobacteria bacterium]